MYKPDKSVVDMITRYDKKLMVWGNPWDDADDEALVIGYKKPEINAMRYVSVEDGIVLSRRAGIPVMWCPKTYHADYRITKGLSDSKIANNANFSARMKAEYNKNYEDMREYHADWCRDVGHWYFKKAADDLNIGTASDKDPARADKEYEDRHGKRKNWL